MDCCDITAKMLKQEIINTRNIIEASENVGLSLQSRAYDLMVNIEDVTPGEYKNMESGLNITYGAAKSPFGQVFIASTPRGINALEFIDDNFNQILSQLSATWSNAVFLRDDVYIQHLADVIFITSHNSNNKLSLLIKGSPFQIKVWRALLTITSGNLTTYSDIARIIKQPTATRAVATAIARNPIGYIIPCHRVIRADGTLGKYHWSTQRKAAIICSEQTNNKK